MKGLRKEGKREKQKEKKIRKKKSSEIETRSKKISLSKETIIAARIINDSDNYAESI